MSISTYLINHYDYKGFGNKAIILPCGSLQSYTTIVMSREGNRLTFNGYYSATTSRHIREYVQQLTNGRLKPMAKDIRKYSGIEFDGNKWEYYND